ncbi:MAG: hypothetical protein HY931_02215 [Candidatus Falkowbacteria bacterium]|nr:MAG: hypothetical protein HY931_02215 [Candidatus Falkowbacteria bacterium]
MKKNMIGNLVAIILILVFAGLLTYFYVSLNRMDKKMMELQNTIGQDSAKITSIVNFFNANLNAQNTNK